MKVWVKFANEEFSDRFQSDLQMFKATRNWELVKPLEWRGQTTIFHVENGHAAFLGLNMDNTKQGLSGNEMIPLQQFTKIKVIKNGRWIIVYSGNGEKTADPKRAGIRFSIGEM